MSEILRFIRRHWIHLLLTIPAVLIVTTLHELAHCAAVWLQGGNVTDIVWWPSANEWGHMCFTFPAGQPYNAAFISLAPYLCESLFCLCAGILSRKRNPWPFWMASVLFFWFFIIPLADMTNTAMLYVQWDTNNDFYNAFGPVRTSVVLAIALAGILFTICGYNIQRRLYRASAISIPAYSILALLAALILMLVTSI